MANVADGTYIILSAKNTAVAVEVAGASDASGANVRLWTRNDSDAQKWSVTNYGTAGAQIACALSGRCLEVANNKMATGTNVRQWEDNNSHAQRWDIVADGKTVTVGGKAYPTYVLKSQGTAFAMDVSGGNAQSGTNIQLYSANNTDAQRFIFIPIEVLSNGGTYKIVSAVAEDMVLDVQGASTANGANVMLHPSNDGSNQRWIAKRNDDNTLTFIGAGSQKALDDKGAGTKPGSNIQIYATNYSTAQSFLVQRLGSMTVAGQTVPTYRMEVQAGMNLNVDVQGGSSKPGTNVRLWTANTSPAQRFAFIPASAPVSTLPTPAGLSIGSWAGNNKTAVTLTFICDYAAFQARCRFRSRKAGGSMGSWSSWKSASDGLGGNEGWGDAWTATFDLDATIGDRKTATVPIPEAYRLDGSTVVATDMQIEVRSHASNWQGVSGYSVHGASVSATFNLVWRPTVTVTAAELTGTGLRIRYTSDLKDGGCTVTVGAMGASETIKGLYGGSGSVIIPAAKLKTIPSGKITCTAKLTRDIASPTASAGLTVTNSSGHQNLTIQKTESAYGTHLITVPAVSTTDKVQAFITAGKTPVASHEKSRSNAKITIEAISPLRSAVSALVWISRNDGSWDVQALTLAAIDAHAFCWVYDGGACVLDFGKGEAPSQEDGISRGVEDYEVIGRAYHSYRLRKAQERSLSVSGAVVKAMPGHGTLATFSELLVAGHATFRNPRGEILPVVITAISQPLAHDDWTEIKVTQYQETR